MSGSRQRYLAEQAQFMYEKFGEVSIDKRDGLSPGMDRQQTIHSLNQRSTNSKLDTLHGGIALGALGALGAKHVPHLKPSVKGHLERGSLATSVIGGGIAGALALRRSHVERANIAAQRKQLGVAKIDTTMSAAEAARHVKQHGASGALPKDMDRATRMKVHEARYIHHGGPKGEKYHARSKIVQHANNTGLAVGTVAGASYLVARSKSKSVGRVGEVIARAIPKARMDRTQLSHRAEMAGVGAATSSGAAQLYGNHLNRKKASHANAPAGVSASALNRMRQMDRSKT